MADHTSESQHETWCPFDGRVQDPQHVCWRAPLAEPAEVYVGPQINIDPPRPPVHQHRWAWAQLVSGGTCQVCRDCGRERGRRG